MMINIGIYGGLGTQKSSTLRKDSVIRGFSGATSDRKRSDLSLHITITRHLI